MKKASTLILGIATAMTMAACNTPRNDSTTSGGAGAESGSMNGAAGGSDTTMTGTGTMSDTGRTGMDTTAR